VDPLPGTSGKGGETACFQVIKGGEPKTRRRSALRKGISPKKTPKKKKKKDPFILSYCSERKEEPQDKQKRKKRFV